jgi:phosphoribosylformylglycinamidine synthase
MLAVVAPGRVAEVREVLDRWGLRSDVIGRVIEQPVVRVLQEGALCAEVPIAALTDCAPFYDWPYAPAPVPPPEPLPRDPLALLAHPNVCSRRWVYRQYDQTVQAATAATDDADAALVLLPGGKRAIALCTDGNFRHDDPYLAGALAVAEAARNVSCTGAAPIALTNCLNFGSPERPEGVWQLREGIRGLADAARALGVPVISGNVSLYNESDEGSVRPTPIVGMLGLLEDAATPLCCSARPPDRSTSRWKPASSAPFARPSTAGSSVRPTIVPRAGCSWPSPSAASRAGSAPASRPTSTGSTRAPRALWSRARTRKIWRSWVCP